LKIFFVIFALFTKFVNAEIIDINNRELSNLIEKKFQKSSKEISESAKFKINEISIKNAKKIK